MEIKTFNDYAEWTGKLWSGIGDDNEHAILGVQDEIGELAAWKKKTHYGKEIDITNLKEELGDLLFYLTRLYIQNGCRFIIEFTGYSSKLHFFIDSKRIAELNKYTNKLIDAIESKSANDLSVMLSDLIYYVKFIIHTYGFTIEEIINCNVAKLETRYNKGKFDADNATNRDKEAEHAAINSVGCSDKTGNGSR